MAFMASLFPVLRFEIWHPIVGIVYFQMFAGIGNIPSVVFFVFFGRTRDAFFSLRYESLCWIVGLYVGFLLYRWAKTVTREVFLYRYILSGRVHMMTRPVRQWLALAFGWPFLSFLSNHVFVTMATWRMLVHCVFHDSLVYITAPKALNKSVSINERGPAKSSS